MKSQDILFLSIIMIVNTLLVYFKHIGILEHWMKVKSWDDSYGCTEYTERPQREIWTVKIWYLYWILWLIILYLYVLNIFHDGNMVQEWKAEIIAIDTQNIQRVHREKYEKSRYDIPIEYFDCKYFINVFEHIGILKYWVKVKSWDDSIGYKEYRETTERNMNSQNMIFISNITMVNVLFTYFKHIEMLEY
jgi:hypothetical protein